MFAGAKASRVPGHQAISAVLVLLLLVLVGLAGSLWQRLLAYLESATRRGRTAAIMGLLVAAAVAEQANRVVLPRLYPWFHVSLGLLFVAACVLAARAVLCGRLRRPPARLRMVALLASVLGLAGLGAHELSVVGASQSLRFFAYEKTQVSSLALRLLPARHARPGAGSSGAVAAARGQPIGRGTAPA